MAAKKIKEEWVTIGGNPVFVGEETNEGRLEKLSSQGRKALGKTDSNFIQDYYGMGLEEYMKTNSMIDTYVDYEIGTAEAKSSVNEIIKNDKLYRGTQKYFKEKGVTEVTLYRGITKDIAPDVGEITLKNKSGWKGSSWTDSPSVAKSFAEGKGEVLVAKIPVSQIVTSHKTYRFFRKDENEYIVKGDVSGVTQKEQFKRTAASMKESVSIELTDEDMMWLRKIGKKTKESATDFSSWDPTVLAIETPEELLDRLDSVYELWTIRGASEQDENILNAYLNLKSELEKRKIDFEPIEEFEDMEARLEEGIRPAFGSSGGKKYLARTICSYIPDHKIYVEPFIGGGAVFFKKNPSEKEVINDLDKEISGAYKYIKEGKFDGLNKYRKDGDREYFKQIKASEPKTLEEQFHKFIYTLHFSFGNGRTSFAPSKLTLEPRIQHLPKVSERLKNTEVKNEDFRNLLKEYDSPETFFYLDPPYPEQQGKLKTDLKNEDLWEAVKDLKGKWIMSLPDTPIARQTFRSCFIEGVEVRRTFNMATDHKDLELLISNFPLKQSTTWISESVVTASWLDDYALEIKSQIDEVGNIILVPNYICLSGSTLYAKDRVPNDTDIIWKEESINPAWDMKVRRLLKKITGSDPCVLASVYGPNWRHYPLWNLALVPVKGAQFEEVGDQEPGFASRVYEAKRSPEDYPQNYGTLTTHFRGKSVSDLTPIIIRRDGKVEVIPIWSLYNSNRDGEHPVNGIEVWGKHGWEKIKYIFRHSINDNLIRVNASGGSVDVTKEHSLFQDGESIEANKLKITGKIDIANLPDIKGSVSVAKDYAWVLGFFLAEGSYDKKKRTTKFTQKEYYPYLENIEKFAKHYGFLWHRWKEKDGIYSGSWNIAISQLDVFRQFDLKAPHHFKTRTARLKIIPSFIFDWDRKSKDAFLEGFFAGDGDHKNGELKGFSSSSQSLAQGIIILSGIKSFSVRLQENLFRIQFINDKHHASLPRNEIREILESKKSYDISGEKNPNFKDGKHCKFKIKIKKQEWIYSIKRKVYDIETESHSFVAGVGMILAHNSAHLDFRRKQDGYLEGETIMTQPEGLITEEVDTIEKGKKWTAVLFEKGKFRPDMDPNEKVVMVGKNRQPLIWLNAREVSYDPGTVGATKFEPGVFITMDEGMVYPGAQKPHFKEFFLDMKKFKGRMVERVIGAGPEWDEQPVGGTEWQTWFNLEDQTPYILSKRQRKDKRDYIPADGEKAIPPEWEQKIQPEFRWWEKGLADKEKMHRLDLAYSDLIERGYIKADKLTEEQMISTPYEIATTSFSHDITLSSFPIELTYENNTYSLVKTKNGKLLLNK